MWKATAILLITSAINLAMMIPGGVVETRSFPIYPVSVIAGFNLFLAVLGLGSLLVAAMMFRKGRGIGLARLAAVSYLAVYMADLSVIFPISTTPMSTLLHGLEWLGVALAALLLFTAFRAKPEVVDAPAAQMNKPVLAGIALLIAGIVIFATISAI